MYTHTVFKTRLEINTTSKIPDNFPLPHQFTPPTQEEPVWEIQES